MHFLPVSDSPYFGKNFRLHGKFPQFYLFRKNVSIFIRQNFWWPFFSPIFAVSVPYISSLFLNNYYFPLLLQISLWFRKSYVFLHTFGRFSFLPSLTMMHLYITQCTHWTPLMSCLIITSNKTQLLHFLRPRAYERMIPQPEALDADC